MEKNKIQSYSVYLRFKDTDSMKVKGWENMYQANSDHKTAGVAMLISTKTVFKTRNSTWKETFHNDELQYIRKMQQL